MVNWLTKIDPLLTICGLIISTTGLIFSFLAFTEITNVKKKFLFKARIQEIMTTLEEISARMNSHLRNFKIDGNLFFNEISRFEAILKSLNNKVPKESNAAIRETMKRLKTAKKEDNSIGADAPWDLYRIVLSFSERMKQDYKDSKWS